MTNYEVSLNQLTDKLTSRICAWKATGVRRPAREEAMDYIEYVMSELRANTADPLTSFEQYMTTHEPDISLEKWLKQSSDADASNPFVDENTRKLFDLWKAARGSL